MRVIVSFVIPAYQSGLTLGRTLSSVSAQSVGDWEAIVVNDGSDDRTSSIARDWAARDPRISLIEAEHGGPSRARNRGIAMARGEWLVFLDADDTVSPRFLHHMLACANRSSGDGVGVVACGYDRVNEMGAVSARVPPLPLDEDAAVVCASGPPGAIHSFLVRRRCVVEAGGFDEALTTNEDWDLWLRIAVSGARFALVRRQLATYWSTPNSLSRLGEQMLSDGRTVMMRARALELMPQRGMEMFDHREHSVDDVVLRNAFWSGGVAIGQGRSAMALIEHIPRGALVGRQKTHLIEKLIDGLVVGASVPLSQLVFRWPAIRSRIEQFIQAAIAHTGGGHDAFALIALIQTQIARYGRFRDDIDMGHVVALSLSPAVLMRGYQPPPGIEVAVLRFRWLRPATMFSYVVPVFGRLRPGDIVRALQHGSRRRLLVRLSRSERMTALLARPWRLVALARRALGMRRPEPPGFHTMSALRYAAAAEAETAAVAIAEAGLPRRDPAAGQGGHPGTGSDAAEWERFFAREDPWNYGSRYEQLKYERTLSLIPPRGDARALELACAEGRFTRMLAPTVATLRAVDISRTAIERARQRSAECGNVEFAQHDLFRDAIAGTFDLITCSEVLYFSPSHEALAVLVGKIAGALAASGSFVHAHAFELTDDLGRTAFDWEDTVGAAGIHAAFAAEPRLAHVRTTETDLYRIDLFRRVEPGESVPPAIVERVPIGAEIEPAVAAGIVWNGAIRLRSAVKDARVYRLPVLRYDPVPLEALERQLRFLRRRGFASVTTAQLVEGGARAGSLRGRPVMLTIDEGTDPAWVDAAWPVIRRNGFGLHVFTRSTDWARLIALADEGVTFGGALLSGVPADDLPGATLLREATRSRLTLEHVLGVPVTTAAPPLGQSDTRVEQILAAAGYNRLFVADGGIAPVCGLEMQTPRVPAQADWTLEALAAALGGGIEPPDGRDA